MQTVNPTQPSYLSNNINSNANKKNFFGQFASNNSLNKPGNTNSIIPDDIRIQIYYSGIITVIYLKVTTNTDATQIFRFELEKFRQEVRIVCKFDERQPFTIKWVDEEGDPCTISSQDEFDEAGGNKDID